VPLRFVLYFCLPGLLLAQAPVTAPPPQPGQLRDTVSAPSLTSREKFKLRVIGGIGIRGIAGAAFGAAIGQGTNTPSEWGQGAAGYFTRFASGFGNNFNRQVIAFGLETALHEDPRYFPSTSRSTKQRILNVAKQVFIAKKDDGSSTFAYGKIISAFGSAQLTNTWQPGSNNSFGDGIERGIISLGGDAGICAIQEFFPSLRPKELRNRH
jgi:hypothetical protein